MDDKPSGLARQASWKKLIADDLVKAMWFTFSLIVLQTIFYFISDGDTFPKIPYIALSVGLGLVAGIYRGFYSAFRYASGKFPRGAGAGILSGIIYFVVVGGGMTGGYTMIKDGYGVRATVLALLATMFATFIVLFLENEDPEQQPPKE